MSGAGIHFEFESTADESRFLREYLAEAWDRYRASDYWETGWFWAYRQFAGTDPAPDGGLVVLVFEGRPDDLVAAESYRWADFDGLESWDLRRYEAAEDGFDSLLAQQRDAKGEVGGEREYRLKPLASRFSLAYLSEFDDPLPAVADPAEDDLAGMGFWAVFHHLCIQCGYDWHEEIDVYLRGLRNRVKSVATYRDAATAREEYERVRTAVDEMDEHLEEWFENHETGEGTIP